MSSQTILKKFDISFLSCRIDAINKILSILMVCLWKNQNLPLLGVWLVRVKTQPPDMLAA